MIMSGVKSNRASPFFIAAITAICGIGCTDEPASNGTPPAPTPTETIQEARRLLRDSRLRLGVGAMTSPIATHEAYDRLFGDLATSLGRPYELIQRRTYQELNRLIVNNQVHLAFICTGPYVSLPATEIEIVALPVVSGLDTYRALIVVAKDGPIREFADLQGKRFAFTDPLSTAGFFYPVNLVAEIGSAVDVFFSSTTFTGSHDRSLVALRHGLVDAISVYDIHFEQMTGKGTDFEGLFRILERSPPFAVPPVVAPKKVPQQLRKKMREFLLGLTDNSEGRARLAEIGVDRFVALGTHDYEPIRRLMEVATAQQKQKQKQKR